MSKKLGNITIYPNAFKKEDKHPDFKGKGDIEGEKVDIALWVNVSMGGVPINMSGTISEPYDGDDPQPEPTREAAPYRGKNPPKDAPAF